MKKALIYIRVSTEEQARGGISLSVQEKICRKYADENDYQVIEVFNDDGYSGTKMNRPALQDMLLKCQEDKSIDAVIVQETDRLARNTHDHLTIKAILQKAKVNLISVSQPMLDDTPEGNFVDVIMSGVNQLYSQLLGRKVKKVLKEMFESGEYPAKAPLGYKNVVIAQSSDGKRSHKIIKPDPEKWSLIKEGFKMYLTGNYSADETNDVLYDKGLRSWNGKKPSHSIFVATLKNPFYAGLMKWNGEIKQGKHTPMITPKEHKQVLNILANHNRNVCRRRKHNFLLRGFVYCGICGGRYTAETHPKKEKDFYYCRYKKDHTNHNQFVEVADLENQVAELFKCFHLAQKEIDTIMKILKDKHKKQKGDIELEKKGLYARKTAIERKRDLAEEKLLNGVLSDSDFVRIKDRYRSELDNIQNQINESESRREVDFETIRKVAELARDVYKTYKNAPKQLQKAYLGLFWDKILVKDKKIVKAIPTKLFQEVMGQELFSLTKKESAAPTGVEPVLHG